MSKIVPICIFYFKFGAQVTVDPAETGAVGRHATHQGPVVAAHPDGAPRAAQALLGEAVLGQWLLLDRLGQCDRRHHPAVSGITFRQMMLPASAGSRSLPDKVRY